MYEFVKILYLDEVASNAEVVINKLNSSSLNFDFSTIDSTKKLTGALHQFCPDVILCHCRFNVSDTPSVATLISESKEIPFIIISAPDGEETALQMLSCGAVDYLLTDRLSRLPYAICNAVMKCRLQKKKPLEPADTFNKSLQNNQAVYNELFNKAPVWMGYFKGKDFVFETGNAAFLQSITKKEVIGKKLKEVYPEFEGQELFKILNRVFETGASLELNQMEVKVITDSTTKIHFVNILYEPKKNAGNIVEGVFFYATVVTEQVHARKKAEESEAWYRQIVETAREGIWLIDENNRTSFVNSKMCEMLQYKAEELLGNPIQQFMEKESERKSYEQIERRKKGISETHDARFITKSGAQLWTSLTTNPVTDNNGNYRGALAMITDISERREWEKKLLDKKEKLQKVIAQQEAILNALPPQIALLDKNGVIFSVNEAWKKFGKENGVEDENTWLGQNYVKISESATGEDAYYGKKIAENIRNIITGRSPGFSMEYPCNIEWGRKWFKAIVSPLMNKINEGAVVLHIDITERKLAEEQLQEKHEQLLASERIANIGSWERNLSGAADVNAIPIKCSEEAFRIMGLPPGYKYFTYNKFLEMTYQEDVGLIIEASRQANDKTSYNVEHRIVRPDGNIRWVHRDAKFIKDEVTGKPLKVIGTIQDITERKMQEYELKKNSEEREILIRELTKSNKDLKQFTYITSHNFKAPLSNLIGLLGLFDYSTLTKSNREVVEMFKVSTYMLNKTINDLIQILIIKNNVSVNIVKIDIVSLFEEVLNALETEIHEAECQITRNFTIKEIHFNKSYLESILINLISNSLKYRSNIRLLQMEVSTFKNSQGEVVLAICDNGIGIDLKRHGNKIFGLYQRFHNNTDSAGLGLFIVKSQVNALGGHIEVESELDKGTTFRIIFANRK